MTVQDVRSSGLVDLLLDKAGDYLPPDKVAAVEEAYRFAEEAHSGQYRKSGEPFIEHPLSTALYLVDLHFDYNALRAALLHDVVEDTPVTYEELAKHFGEEVATLVDGVTKLTQNELMNTWGEDEVRPVQYTNEAARAASIRKMLMTMAEDVRVVIIKLADRLHNMRTLDSMPENRKVAIAQETLDIYAPLAHRLGMWELKWLLEDLAFQHIDSEAYRAISRLLATKREEREKYIDRVVGMLEDELQAAGIRANVYGRPKHIYSIHRKTEKYDSIKPDGKRYQRPVRPACDCRIGGRPATRPSVSSIRCGGRCRASSTTTSRARRTTCTSRSTRPSCARTPLPWRSKSARAEMHQLAEYGVAAHWLYKEGSADDQSFEEKMTWLRQILEWQREVAGAEEFVEGFKTDIFQNQVFVYHPERRTQGDAGGSDDPGGLLLPDTHGCRAPVHRREGER